MATIWKDIYTHLKDEGFDVYSPQQNIGFCNYNFIVIRTGTVSNLVGTSSNMCYYDIMCYVPENSYSELDEFVKEVKASLLKIYPMIRYADMETPAYFDETAKGHMISLQYVNYKKKVG